MKTQQHCEIFIDGASRGNPGPSGIGVVFASGRGRSGRQFAKYVGQTTNNVAEYLALLYALQEALQAGCQAVTVRTDSELLARQITGRYQVRDSRLRVLHDLAVHLLDGFVNWKIEHIPRGRNAAADHLAAQAVRRNEGSSAVTQHVL